MQGFNKDLNTNIFSRNYTIFTTKIFKLLRFSKEIKIALASVAQWMEHRLQTKGSPVRFPVRAYAWVAGQVPSGGPQKRQPHSDVSLLLFLPPFPSL